MQDDEDIRTICEAMGIEIEREEEEDRGEPAETE